MDGELTKHLNQVDKEVRAKVDMLMKKIADQWGVKEELKMQESYGMDEENE